MLRTIPRRLSSTIPPSIPPSIPTSQTLDWLKRIIIRQNLCPFAALPLAQGKVRTTVSSITPATLETALLPFLSTEITKLLDQTEEHTTSLLIFENTSLFPTYYDQVKASYDILAYIADEGLSDKVQLVNFHPLHVNSLYTDPTTPPSPYDFIGRSPFPTIHLLRTVDLIAAAEEYGNDTELIPNRNRAKMMENGLENTVRDYTFK